MLCLPSSMQENRLSINWYRPICIKGLNPNPPMYRVYEVILCSTEVLMFEKEKKGVFA